MSELFPLAIAAWVFLAWFTHVIVCLKTASWGFLLAGALFFPVGCVHGTGIWFGVF
jgi:hypothetical protein